MFSSRVQLYKIFPRQTFKVNVKFSKINYSTGKFVKDFAQGFSVIF